MCGVWCGMFVCVVCVVWYVCVCGVCVVCVVWYVCVCGVCVCNREILCVWKYLLVADIVGLWDKPGG